MKVLKIAARVCILSFLLSSLSSSCSNNQFESALYNIDYQATQESGVLTVDVNTGIIPIDNVGRPAKDFHMDLYEFPNNPYIESVQNGYLPMINVTWYEARDLCQSFGKRLCTIYEWRETCFSNGAGKRKTDSNSEWRYPYSNAYQTDFCVTETSSPAKSGKTVECRNSFLGIPGSKIADQSGNVWEWVNHDFYNQAGQFDGLQAITGGYYFTGDKATCNLTLIVSKSIKNEKTGFRCCRDKNL